MTRRRPRRASNAARDPHTVPIDEMRPVGDEAILIGS